MGARPRDDRARGTRIGCARAARTRVCFGGFAPTPRQAQPLRERATGIFSTAA
jgi:hypothetical protein